MKFGNSGIQLTIGLDESQLKMITEFIFTQLKDAKQELEDEINAIDRRLTKEINLINGKLP